jgi:Ca2+-binding EF-hand superfamily protein
MSPKASDEDRLRLIFRVFDQDADDLISAEDLIRMLRRLLSTGSFSCVPWNRFPTLIEISRLDM